ncbi:chemotaxis protein CheW [Neokomagataea thailandica NBRC 106555]|uniref:Chemotaxis protein CheW n=2 Tax=Neokomagataea TaxID=1223423 RepID=A0A4Y6V8V9_9PROT|nr:MULTISPECIES: chemotaxis protein CheW [Neokomagataea]QDH25100.1 chemotaxis protein CheW [Neokomagataea tanensis]GBR52159.1 chemotaxis protein CheW [Neokomagataea thailandica NBRC 106555]
MDKALVFACDKYEFAFDIECIKEIKSWIPSTPLPVENQNIEGIINIRGTVIPLISLLNLIGGQKVAENKAIIVIECMGKNIAFSVSGVSDIIEYDLLKEAPKNCFGGNDFIKGIISIGKRTIFSLNENNILKYVIN